LQRLLASAHGRWAMLDVYADWCTACKDLERSTFTHPAVQAELSKTVLLRADVTANTAEQRALLQHLQLVGPPALLFFAPNGQENKTLRVVGYLDSEAFLRLLREIPL
jgi:thiol:disulfide interchange protein DsbD